MPWGYVAWHDMLRKMLIWFWGKMMLCSDEICWAEMPLVVMKFVGAKYGNKNVKIILVKKWCYVVMKFVGAKYGNKNVKIILVKKWCYVVMKFVGAKYGNKNVKIILVKKWCYVVMKFVGAKYGNKNVKIILVKKWCYVVMKFVGAKYGNKKVKIILVKKWCYVVMKYFGGKSCQATYPHALLLLQTDCSRGAGPWPPGLVGHVHQDFESLLQKLQAETYEDKSQEFCKSLVQFLGMRVHLGILDWNMQAKSKNNLQSWCPKTLLPFKQFNISEIS